MLSVGQTALGIGDGLVAFVARGDLRGVEVEQPAELGVGVAGRAALLTGRTHHAGVEQA